MKTLKKYDFFNIGAIILAIAGVIVEYVGGAFFSKAVDIGFNFNLSPVIFVGIGLMVVGLILAIIGTAVTERYQLNKKISTIALYITVIALMFALVYIALVILMPVLRPANG